MVVGKVKMQVEKCKKQVKYTEYIRNCYKTGKIFIGYFIGGTDLIYHPCTYLLLLQKETIC